MCLDLDKKGVTVPRNGHCWSKLVGHWSGMVGHDRGSMWGGGLYLSKKLIYVVESDRNMDQYISVVVVL